MKSFRIILSLAVCAAFTGRATPVAVDGIKAVVGAETVTFSEVEEKTMPAAASLLRDYSGQRSIYEQKLNEARNDSLQQLVERQVILNSFKTEGYKLPDSVIDEIIDARIREQFGDRVSFRKKLQEQGMTAEQYRQQVRNQYIEGAMRNQNGKRDIFISPYKIENYYLAHQDDFKVEDQIKLRMIVLTKTSADDTNALNLAHEIQTRIKDGTPFTEMATVYSQGSQQHQGGDWGWVSRTVLVKQLSDVAFSLPLNTVSDVVDTDEACYLMLVEDKHPAHARPLPEVAAEIEKNLRIELEAKYQKKWIEGLKKKTLIRYF